MNETLYRWTFKFQKVLWQQNSGAVEDFILPYSAVYLRIQKWKNYWNPSTLFAKVIVKIKVAPFYGSWYCIVTYTSGTNISKLMTDINTIQMISFAVKHIAKIFPPSRWPNHMWTQIAQIVPYEFPYPSRWHVMQMFSSFSAARYFIHWGIVITSAQSLRLNGT